MLGLLNRLGIGKTGGHTPAQWAEILAHWTKHADKFYFHGYDRELYENLDRLLQTKGAEYELILPSGVDNPFQRISQDNRVIMDANIPNDVCYIIWEHTLQRREPVYQSFVIDIRGKTRRLRIEAPVRRGTEYVDYPERGMLWYDKSPELINNQNDISFWLGNFRYEKHHAQQYSEARQGP